MSGKKIICRADGNSSVGLGHIYRMLAIAEFYRGDYEVIFVTKKSSLTTIIPEVFKTILVPENVSIEEEPKWFANNFSVSEYFIIADGYQFVSSYQKAIKNSGFKLIYIDDLVKEHMYADVVVNHSPYNIPAHYKAENYTEFALGTDFAMLRPLFNEAAKEKRKINQIKNAFVCFGGADQYDLSLRASKALLNINAIENIHVVIGGAYKHKEIIRLEKENNKLYLHKNLDEKSLYELMKICQIAIVPSSTILYEICSVKMPVLSGYYVDNQKNIYKGLAEKGIIVKGGDFSNYTISDFEEKINNILESSQIDLYLENQYNLFKGNGKVNFLGLINRSNITFKKAEAEDMLLVYNWSNDELVRKNSYDSNEIKIEDHKKWFFQKIKDKQCLFLIALVNNKPAGIVRFDIKEEYAIIGILVSKEYRGKKLANDFLKKSAIEYFKNNTSPIQAYIKKDNKASIKAFETAKYIYAKEEMIKGCISFVYKLEKEDVKR